MSILTDYKVQLVNRLGFGKQIFSTNTWMSAYISDHYDISRANFLLDDINSVLNNTSTRGGGQTQSLYFADIYFSETKYIKISKHGQKIII